MGFRRGRGGIRCAVGGTETVERGKQDINTIVQGLAGDKARAQARAGARASGKSRARSLDPPISIIIINAPAARGAHPRISLAINDPRAQSRVRLDRRARPVCIVLVLMRRRRRRSMRIVPLVLVSVRGRERNSGDVELAREVSELLAPLSLSSLGLGVVVLVLPGIRVLRVVLLVILRVIAMLVLIIVRVARISEVELLAVRFLLLVIIRGVGMLRCTAVSRAPLIAALAHLRLSSTISCTGANTCAATGCTGSAFLVSHVLTGECEGVACAHDGRRVDVVWNSDAASTANERVARIGAVRAVPARTDLTALLVGQIRSRMESNTQGKIGDRSQLMFIQK